MGSEMCIRDRVTKVKKGRVAEEKLEQLAKEKSLELLKRHLKLDEGTPSEHLEFARRLYKNYVHDDGHDDKEQLVMGKVIWLSKLADFNFFLKDLINGGIVGQL